MKAKNKTDKTPEMVKGGEGAIFGILHNHEDFNDYPNITEWQFHAPDFNGIDWRHERTEETGIESSRILTEGEFNKLVESDDIL